MKDRARKPSAFKAFTHIFTRNWGLKLVSLALAILVYYTLKPNGAGGSASRPEDRTSSPVVAVIEQVAHAAPPSAPAVKPSSTSDNTSVPAQK